MSQSQESKADAAQQRSEETRSFVRTVKAATRRRYTPEEKILVVLEGFRREGTVNDCWQSAQVGQIRTREGYYYEELRGSSLRVLL